MTRVTFWAIVALAVQPLAAAPVDRLSLQESFRIGTGGVPCTAQLRPMDPKLKGMFDRAYAVTCRDAAAPVGALYALKDATPEQLAVAGRRCEAEAAAEVPKLTGVRLSECAAEDRLRHRTYTLARGGTLYAAQGLAGYDSALKLGLASLVTDRPVAGDVQVAVTAAGDPAAFARVQAGALDPEGALAEAYVRNNSGSYAESAEFFQTLYERAGGASDTARASEYLVNQGLQQSNLGQFPAADAAFAQAEARGAALDPIVGRLLRNYRAIHAINQRRAPAALDALKRDVASVDRDAAEAIGGAEITPRLAEEINRANTALNRTAGLDFRLTPFERAQILDAQAEQLRGVALRLQGRRADALQALDRADAGLAGVRGGRVLSAAFMRAEILAEAGAVREAGGEAGAAETALKRAVTLLETSYPLSAALLQARARLAAFYARQRRSDEAAALYAAVIGDSERVPGAAAALRQSLAPYFALLAERSATDPQAAAAMFAATQVFVRPGVAQTQAVLARELSGGDDEAAMLFRQAVNQSREVVRQSAEVAQLAAAPDAGGDGAAALAAARARLQALETEQTALQSRLSRYPKYRVLAPQALTLADLQKSLKAHEAYYQFRLVGEDAYAVFATPTSARAVKLGTSQRRLSDTVARLRDSIVRDDGGQLVTLPFDVAQARALYRTLFDPLGPDALTGVNHLVFEPDGPLLQLPPTLLVSEQAGVDAFLARAARPGGDRFDLRGVAWLGKARRITTAVSARSFTDVRAIPASAGGKAYLGLGENAPPFTAASFLATGGPVAQDACDWPLETWNKPISAAELSFARAAIGEARAAVLTGADFSDTAIAARPDLRDYRVLHFATHGLVTAPRPQCPARPALVTSFGAAGSDGLLSFREVYDLKIDADYVILSACDTAGMATVSATREAGVATGGNFALDGLVRAFVGAGARNVIASHWPVPDDYEATRRLITGLFSAEPGTSAGQALRTAQLGLMDDADTSHPYYWAAFAIVGDGERALLTR